jgi:hypothetical protein
MIAVEQRLQLLEDDRAIRDLKARYLFACDQKDGAALRDTLCPEGVTIAFDGFPEFADREAFVAVFETMACQGGVFDIHHGSGGVIEFDTPDHARGKWSLLFHSINLAARTLTQFGVIYHDRYRKRDGRWWIVETRSHRTSCLIHTVDAAGAPTVAAMGEAPAVYGADDAI